MQPVPHHAVRIQRQEEPAQIGPEVSIMNEALSEMDLKRRWGDSTRWRQGRSSFQVDDQEHKQEKKKNQKIVSNLQETNPTI